MAKKNSSAAEKAPTAVQKISFCLSTGLLFENREVFAKRLGFNLAQNSITKMSEDKASHVYLQLSEEARELIGQTFELDLLIEHYALISKLFLQHLRRRTRFEEPTEEALFALLDYALKGDASGLSATDRKHVHDVLGEAPAPVDTALCLLLTLRLLPVPRGTEGDVDVYDAFHRALGLVDRYARHSSCFDSLPVVPRYLEAVKAAGRERSSTLSARSRLYLIHAVADSLQVFLRYDNMEERRQYGEREAAERVLLPMREQVSYWLPEADETEAGELPPHFFVLEASANGAYFLTDISAKHFSDSTTLEYTRYGLFLSGKWKGEHGKVDAYFTHPEIIFDLVQGRVDSPSNQGWYTLEGRGFSRLRHASQLRRLSLEPIYRADKQKMPASLHLREADERARLAILQAWESTSARVRRVDRYARSAYVFESSLVALTGEAFYVRDLPQQAGSPIYRVPLSLSESLASIRLTDAVGVLVLGKGEDERRFVAVDQLLIYLEVSDRETVARLGIERLSPREAVEQIGREITTIDA